MISAPVNYNDDVIDEDDEEHSFMLLQEAGKTNGEKEKKDTKRYSLRYEFKSYELA